jgi:beta-lactamase regulating signal transducer with metallopeptidase domain
VHEVLNWVWQGCAIAGATAVTLRLLKRSRARDRYALSWIALVSVLVLPLFSDAWVAPTDALPAADRAAAPLLAMPEAWWTSLRIVILLWTLWICAHVIRLATALVRVRRVLRGSAPFPSTTESRLIHWRRAKQHGRQARMVLGEGVRSAAVLGCGRPVIAVAPALIERLSLDELDRVVIHEWAHVQRRDDLLNVVHALTRTVAGWHPAVWWLSRQLQIEREAACDEIAVAITGSSKGYASSLAALASLFPLRLQTISTLGALSSPTLSTRILRILSQKQLASRTVSASTAVIAAASICALSVTIADYEVVGRAITPLIDVVHAAAPQSHARNTPASSITLADRPATNRRTEVQLTRKRPLARGRDVQDRALPLEPLRPIDSSLARSNQPLDIHVIAPQRMVDVPISPTSGDAVVSPWGVAADTGVNVARRTQNTALATAGAFSRFGRKIAASF